MATIAEALRENNISTHPMNSFIVNRDGSVDFYGSVNLRIDHDGSVNELGNVDWPAPSRFRRLIATVLKQLRLA